jgi:hypothetical protein
MAYFIFIFYVSLSPFTCLVPSIVNHFFFVYCFTHFARHHLAKCDVEWFHSLFFLLTHSKCCPLNNLCKQILWVCVPGTISLRCLTTSDFMCNKLRGKILPSQYLENGQKFHVCREVSVPLRLFTVFITMYVGQPWN